MSDTPSQADLEAMTSQELVNEIHDATDRGDHQGSLTAFRVWDDRDLDGTDK